MQKPNDRKMAIMLAVGKKPPAPTKPFSDLLEAKTPENPEPGMGPMGGVPGGEEMAEGGGTIDDAVEILRPLVEDKTVSDQVRAAIAGLLSAFDAEQQKAPGMAAGMSNGQTSPSSSPTQSSNEG